MSDRSRHGPVKSVEDLHAIVQVIQTAFPDRLLLFRGQDSLHDTVRSGRARSQIEIVPEVELGWKSFTRRLVAGHPNSVQEQHSFALLQHYGLPTFYLDLTADPEIAAWFTLQNYKRTRHTYIGSPARMFHEVNYAPTAGGIGYLIVFGFPNATELARTQSLIDLSYLPENFLRPHRQKAWLFYDRPPIMPSAQEFWIATIEVDRSAFQSRLATKDLFPNPTLDRAYASLLTTPYVQIPPLKIDDPSKGITSAFYAIHVLDVDNYQTDDFELGLAHKWNDITLWEADPFRQWQSWKFPLEEHYEGVHGCISNSKKVILAPWVNEELHALAGRQRTGFRWPDLASNDIVFSFAYPAHDKYIGDDYPSRGVWLHKEDDLVIEHPLVVETEGGPLVVCAGHLYSITGGRVSRLDTTKSCTCGHRETHDRRIRAMLLLHRGLKDGKFSISGHPLSPENILIAF